MILALVAVIGQDALVALCACLVFAALRQGLVEGGPLRIVPPSKRKPAEPKTGTEDEAAKVPERGAEG